MQNCVVAAHAVASDTSEGSRPSQLCTSIVPLTQRRDRVRSVERDEVELRGGRLRLYHR